MEKKVAKKVPVKDLLFKTFKKAKGMKVFVIKFNNDHEKVIYNKVLAVLKDKNYLSYSVNFSNIQIFLTDAGRKVVDEQEQWEIA